MVTCLCHPYWTTWMQNLDKSAWEKKRVYGAQLVTGVGFCVHSRTLMLLLFKSSMVSLGALGISCLLYSPCARHRQPGLGPTSNAMVPDGIWFCLSRHCFGSLSPGLCQPQYHPEAEGRLSTGVASWAFMTEEQQNLKPIARLATRFL